MAEQLMSLINMYATDSSSYTAPFVSDFAGPTHVAHFVDDLNDSIELATFSAYIAVFELFPDMRPRDSNYAGDKSVYITDVGIDQSWALWENCRATKSFPTIKPYPRDGDENYQPSANPDEDITVEEATSVNKALEIIYSNKGAMATFMIDLCAAYSVKSFKKRNYESYCKMRGGPVPEWSSIEPLIKWASSSFKGFMNSDAGRSRLSSNDWIKFHTSFSSAGAVCLRMWSIFPPEYEGIISSDARIAALASSRAPWDRNLMREIPVKELAIANIAVRVTGIEMGKFYSGDTAEMSLSPHEVARYEALIKKLIKLDNKIKGIVKAKTISQVYLANGDLTEDQASALVNSEKERMHLALKALNRKAAAKIAKEKASENDEPFLHTFETVSKSELDEVAEEDY